LSKLKTTEKCNCYIIALGINDMSEVTLGTIDDIGTENNTFYRNLAKIVTEILDYNEHAKIIFSTMASNSVSASPYNQAIIAIAEHYNLPYIAQYNDDFFKSAYYTGSMVDSHPTTATYGAMANALRRMIENCIAANQAYFNDINVFNDN
jgi:lysophospholipase L1-like esterase